MATIAHNTPAAFSSAQITETELTGTDDLALTGSRNILFIRNASGSSDTITLHGDESTDMAAEREGGGTVDLSQDVSIVVPNGETHSLDLGSVRDFLRGTITVGGGATGVFAFILD